MLINTEREEQAIISSSVSEFRRHSAQSDELIQISVLLSSGKRTSAAAPDTPDGFESPAGTTGTSRRKSILVLAQLQSSTTITAGQP
jgi:hypothetical protein